MDLHSSSLSRKKKRWKQTVVLKHLTSLLTRVGKLVCQARNLCFSLWMFFWMAIHWVVHESALVCIDISVLILLGIVIVGSSAGLIADVNRRPLMLLRFGMLF